MHAGVWVCILSLELILYKIHIKFQPRPFLSQVHQFLANLHIKFLNPSHAAWQSAQTKGWYDDDDNDVDDAGDARKWATLSMQMTMSHANASKSPSTTRYRHHSDLTWNYPHSFAFFHAMFLFADHLPWLVPPPPLSRSRWFIGSLCRTKFLRRFLADECKRLTQ